MESKESASAVIREWRKLCAWPGSCALLMLLLSVLACSYGKGAPVIKAGVAFNFNNLSKIKIGMVESEARRLLGPPLEIRNKNGVGVLIYFAHEVQKGTTYILGFLPITRIYYSVKCNAEIHVLEGRVVNVEIRKEYL